MKARWITVACGLVVGALCAASLEVPAIRALEQRFGLQWLFDLRGPVEPPQHAILILMNERSADSISLPRDPRYGRRRPVQPPNRCRRRPGGLGIGRYFQPDELEPCEPL